MSNLNQSHDRQVASLDTFNVAGRDGLLSNLNQSQDRQEASLDTFSIAGHDSLLINLNKYHDRQEASINTFNVAGRDGLVASLSLDERLYVSRVGEGHVVEASTNGQTGQSTLLPRWGGGHSDCPENNAASRRPRLYTYNV